MPNLGKTEKEFDSFFARIGFSRVSEEPDLIPDQENADYINKAERAVIELKIIDKEHFPDGGIIDSLAALIVKPENIKPDGTGMYSFTLPQENREGRHDNFEEPLRRILKKANRQVRESRTLFFNSPEAGYGYVVIALVGLTSVSPQIVGRLAKKLLEAEFSSIDAAIICRPYEQLFDPTTGQPHVEAVSFSVNGDEAPKRLCFEIGEKWVVFRKEGGHPF